VDERVRQAGLLYERAVFTGDAAPLAEADRELDAAEADLAVARGRSHWPSPPRRGTRL
jgi:CYTH domain-containing protein